MTKSKHKKKTTPPNMSIALCCIAKNEERYIEDWIKYHMGLGFDKVVIYNNDDDQTILPKLLQDYVDKSSVTIIPWRNIPGKNMQFFAYENFVKRFGKQYKYAAYLDVDEFLVLNKHRSVKDLIEEFFTAKVGSIAIHWYLFGTNNHRRYKHLPVVQRFTRRSRKLTSISKSINLSKAVLGFNSAHAPILKAKYVHLDLNRKGRILSDSIAHINHYISKSMQECRERSMIRGRVPRHRKHNFSTLKYNEVRDVRALRYYKSISK